MQHLGNGPLVKGKDFEGPGTLVPYELLKNLKTYPTPFSLSSTVVTLGGSASKPVSLWAGDDLIHIRKSLTYTFAETDNAILSSSGAETTGASALGVWYFYVAISKSSISADATDTFIPSQTAPSAIDYEKNVGYLGHPGTSATKKYVYVGHVICSNATGPAFVDFTKVGNTYMILESEKLEQPTTDTSYAALGFTGAEALPAHDGVKAGGYIETSATSGDTVNLAYDANGSGAIIVKTVAAVVNLQAFSGVPLNSGDLYAKHGTAAGDVHITQLEDVI
jgi:hypothetical protein